MLQNIAVVALLVVVLWALILIVFLSMSRRQNDIQAEMRQLDEELDRIAEELESGQ
jgi:Flp pilus assembly protein TadB